MEKEDVVIYYLSLFKLPEGVARKLDGIQSRFLWGDSDTIRKLHLIKWNKLTRSKDKGGLGFGKLRLMNDVLLLKWWWRFGTERDNLWKKLICERYGIPCNCWLPILFLCQIYQGFGKVL